MARFLCTPHGSSNAPDGVEVVRNALAARWPCMADVLCGVEPVDGLEGSAPPLSIIFFAEGPIMKFCLSRYKGVERAYGTIQEPSLGLDGLEIALANGDYEWASRRAKNRS